MAKMKTDKLNLTGTSDRAYDLDEIVSNTRDNADKPLVVQVHMYGKNESPNPANLKVGQLWVSIPKK